MKITDQMLKDLENDSGLQQAVIDWLLNEDEKHRDGLLSDLLQHGCESGMVPGLIYYSDTVKFYEKHKSDIYDLAHDQAESFGHKNVFELFANLNGVENVGSIDQMENLLAWYGFDEMARSVACALGLEA